MAVRGSPPTGLRWTEHADLTGRNTFGVAARARWLAEAGEVAAVGETLAEAKRRELPLIVLGGGSNVLIVGDLEAVVLVPALRGIDWLDSDGGRVHVRAGAGEPWHDFVAATLAAGAFGLENLALIPGSVGAAPIQNIGAYGVELAEWVVAVECLDRSSGAFVRLSAAECAFGYRDSVFKHDPDRYLVTAVEFALRTEPDLRFGYAGLAEEMAAQGRVPSPQAIFEAVCAIRRRKLPDPAQIGNAGSFFKNPVIDHARAKVLREHHPGLPVYPAPGGMAKLAAAWLIEACGWKGHREGDAGVHAAHALVLVNHGHASGTEILALARRIQASVAERFGVLLEPEPRILGQAP
jgi:UDP-N-acetylmuramate dehydrogenase